MSGLIPVSQSLAQIPFKITERDILAELLADKRSPETRRAYAKDLTLFFLAIADSQPSPALIRQFLELERFTAISLVLQYKAGLIEQNLAEATVNRRLAAVKSLVRYAQKIGKCAWSLEEISGEKIRSYRDTSGVDKDSFKAILAIPDRSTKSGKRDYAIFRLLWENVLRRGEIEKTSISDFDPDGATLSILGKGRGTQKERVSLSAATVEAITMWMSVRENYSLSDPLFTALDNAHFGHRLTGTAIYNLVKDAAEMAGIKKRMSPHRVRHSGITEALNLSGGDVRRVQKLSRHSKLDILMIYDDARKNVQSEITDLLSGAIDIGAPVV